MILRGRRHLAYSAPDDFVIETNESFLSIWGKLSGAFFGVTILIASISLVVGGIVIMNIMLVSVTERTREIGLRKSLGARQSDIRLQFLIESSTIAAIGGIWGVLWEFCWRKSSPGPPLCPVPCSSGRCWWDCSSQPAWGCSLEFIRRRRRRGSIQWWRYVPNS